MAYSAAIAVAVGEELGLSDARSHRPRARPSYVAHRVPDAGASACAEGRLVHGRLLQRQSPGRGQRRWRFWRTPRAAGGWRCWATWGSWGPDRTGPHYNMVGRTTARLGLDAVIAIGPKAAGIAETAGPRAQHFAAIEEALPALRRQLGPGTAVLVKASHAMDFGRIVSAIGKNVTNRPYDRYQRNRPGQVL